MKVLLPINIDRWQSPISSLLRSCVEFNPQVEFVSFSSPFSEEDKVKSVDFWRLPNLIKGDPLSVFRHRFDLVHIASHTNRNLAAGTIAKLVSLNHTKFLYTINLELMESDRETFIYKWFNAVVDEYVSVSKAASTLVRRDAAPCYRGVIPNGYDPEFFNPGIDDEAALPEAVRKLGGRPYVLNVAALEPRKHPEWIIGLARANPDLTFVMAGWVVPGLGEDFFTMIQECGLPNLVWLGMVERRAIRALLRYAAAFAFPSEREGLPLSVIEAMGMGVPVVAQPKSSLPELVTGPECGKLIDLDAGSSLEQWSGALRYYTSMDAGTRGQFKSRLSTHTRDRFSWESIGRSYGDLYQRICSDRAARA